MTEIKTFFRKILKAGEAPMPGDSLAFFRIVFGFLMLFAELRFISKGWIVDFYIKPQFFFPFYGFEWIKPLPEPYIYLVFYGLVLLSVLVILGLFYRFAIVAFFLTFTYVELLDKSVYLNHYYQVSLLSFLMCFLPMNAVCSLDQRFFPKNISADFQKWMLWALRLQVGLVYFFGGIAKLRCDWLFEAQPLRIWLNANQDFPVIGSLLTETWVAFILSWFALFFDLSAPFLLSFRKTRVPAFVMIVVFHLLTHFLFFIGMFPWMMLFCVLIFFPVHFHQKVLSWFSITNFSNSPQQVQSGYGKTLAVLCLFFLFQFIFPFRSYAYGGNVLWHEQGFRFSWNIMLMEKNASLEYVVKVKKTGREFTIRPGKFLTKIQARQCSFQPDMILQFAHFLHDYYLRYGLGETEIRAICHASVNGHASELLIDPTVDLAQEKDSFAAKKWIKETE